MSRLRLSAALTGACLALLLSACAGGGDSMSGAARPEAAAVGAPVAPTAAQEREGGEQKTPSGTDVKVTQEPRQIIYTARLTVRAEDVVQAAAKARQIVTEAGGYVSKEDSSSSEESGGRATLEFKVPPAAYPAVLASLGKDLGRQLSSTQNAEDVTQQVADVGSRVKSAEESLASLRTLLKQATTVGQVMEVEQQIYSRTSELESLQAQQKELARQSAHATIGVELIGPAAPEPKPEQEPGGFFDGLKGGWEALVSFVGVALLVIGALVPWLLVFVPLLLIVTYLVRRRDRRAPPPVIEPEREREPV